MKADQPFISDIPLPSEDDPDLFDANCDPANPKTLTFDEVRLARERIKDGIIYTNCKKSRLSSEYGMEIYFKEEFLQVTGSFKERGARNVLLQLTPDEAKRGVIACSAGNHALGLAYHGKLLNIPVTVIMPENASVMKRERCASFGGRVLLKGKNMFEAVESENCPGFNQAMLAGKPVYTENFPSCADGLAISMVGVNAFQTCRHLVDKVITLNESHIHRAVVRLLEVEKCVVECSAATSLAVIMADMLPELVGKNIKDISQDRTWLKSSVFEVQVKCICETRDFVQASDLERALKAKYKHVVWGDESIW
ncbi:unnamed protein product [Trichobilharzia szidati]|nr:unnamed protein product [Trichobilharzia szidati]